MIKRIPGKDLRLPDGIDIPEYIEFEIDGNGRIRGGLYTGSCEKCGDVLLRYKEPWYSSEKEHISEKGLYMHICTECKTSVTLDSHNQSL